MAASAKRFSDLEIKKKQSRTQKRTFAARCLIRGLLFIANDNLLGK